VTVSPRLLELLERDELDWNNEKHREAYLRAWVNGEVKPYPIHPQAEVRPWSEVRTGDVVLHKGARLEVLSVRPAAPGRLYVTALAAGREAPREYEIPAGHLTAVAAKE
jgi:hypothetical protein